ncbi:hypothetical protein [Kingella oralis]|uniref:hypothetical protein n=1 Tax=Kingella oralis TaxID=505 RepID=UPI0034E4F6A8
MAVPLGQPENGWRRETVVGGRFMRSAKGSLKTAATAADGLSGWYVGYGVLALIRGRLGDKPLPRHCGADVIKAA